MKKFLTAIVIALVSIIAPAISAAAVPEELKQVENELNSQLPMDMGDGITLLKIAFSEKYITLSLSSVDLDSLTKSDCTPAARQEFRDAFLGALGSNNEFSQLCQMLNLNLRVKLYKTDGTEMFTEDFTLSQLTR